MNILHVTPLYAPAWQFGGVVRSVSALAEACAAKGARVSVITTSIGTPYERQKQPPTELRYGVEVMYCPASRSPVGILSNALTQAVAAALPATDVCHITGVWQPSVLAAAHLCKKKGIPYVTSPRGALSPYSFRDGWLKKRAYYALCERGVHRNATAVHATSPLEECELKALLPEASVHVIPNICNARQWFPDRAGAAEWRRAHGVKPNTPVFLHVGRVEPKKNLPFLGEVARRLPLTSDWRFILVGPAEESELSRVTASFHNISDRLLTVSGTGSEEELRGAYSAATCLVMPSFHENFGNVVVEALYCGTPVITSDRVGVALMLIGSPLLKVIALRTEAWSNTLSTLLSDQRGEQHSLELIDLQSRFLAPRIADLMMCMYATTSSGQHQSKGGDSGAPNTCSESGLNASW